MPKKSAGRAPTLPHNCVTFDDGRGRKWHVPFDEVGSIPGVGEEVLLPQPDGSDKRHSVIGVTYQFVRREAPEEAAGLYLRRNDKSMYARLFDVKVMIR